MKFKLLLFLSVFGFAPVHAAQADFIQSIIEAVDSETLTLDVIKSLKGLNENPLRINDNHTKHKRSHYIPTYILISNINAEEKVKIVDWILEQPKFDHNYFFTKGCNALFYEKSSRGFWSDYTTSLICTPDKALRTLLCETLIKILKKDISKTQLDFGYQKLTECKNMFDSTVPLIDQEDIKKLYTTLVKHKNFDVANAIMLHGYDETRNIIILKKLLDTITLTSHICNDTGETFIDFFIQKQKYDCAKLLIKKGITSASPKTKKIIQELKPEQGQAQNPSIQYLQDNIETLKPPKMPRSNAFLYLTGLGLFWDIYTFKKAQDNKEKKKEDKNNNDPKPAEASNTKIEKKEIKEKEKKSRMQRITKHLNRWRKDLWSHPRNHKKFLIPLIAILGLRIFKK